MSLHLTILIVALVAMAVLVLWLNHNVFVPLTNNQKKQVDDHPLDVSLYDRFLLPALTWICSKYAAVALVVIVLAVAVGLGVASLVNSAAVFS